MAVFKENLTWIQNGEPMSAGFNGSNAGIINRPLRELLDNTKQLNNRVTSLERSFSNKNDSFFIVDNNIRVRVVSTGTTIAYLPSLETDGFLTTLIKIGGILVITPQMLDKIYTGQINQSLTNSDEFSVITLDYSLTTKTWYPIYKTGTWTF